MRAERLEHEYVLRVFRQNLGPGAGGQIEPGQPIAVEHGQAAPELVRQAVVGLALERVFVRRRELFEGAEIGREPFELFAVGDVVRRLRRRQRSRAVNASGF